MIRVLWVQARAQAARLAQYEVHVLVAQPYAQEVSGQPRPQRQPCMLLDGAELDTVLVNNLLQNAHCTGAPNAVSDAAIISASFS
jgi:hypothetical protein